MYISNYFVAIIENCNSHKVQSIKIGKKNRFTATASVEKKRS